MPYKGCGKSHMLILELNIMQKLLEIKKTSGKMQTIEII